MNPLDRKLCVLAFRRVCPWNLERFDSPLLSGDKSSGLVAFSRHLIWRQVAVCREFEVMSYRVEAGVKRFRRLVKSDSHGHPSPRFLARARWFAGHDARRELRNDVDLRGIGESECTQCAFESIDQLATLAFVRAAVARQRCELVADTLQRLGDRRREL